jgi:GNAT superfamily N-acetyltransferase
MHPTLGAAWQDFGGTYAFFVGADSPMTQTFGLGMFEPVTADSLAAIEAFFTERGAATMHEVSPLAGVETYALLVERGYTPIELSTVLLQRLEPQAIPRSELVVRTIAPADHATWIDISVAGWSEDPAVAAIIRPLAEVNTRNRAMTHFLVERDGQPIATGSMGIHDGIALLAGASTIPSARGLGAQSLLLAARLAEAHRRGCELAMMVTAVGSASQRNAQRNGFQVVYTRAKWRR